MTTGTGIEHTPAHQDPIKISNINGTWVGQCWVDEDEEWSVHIPLPFTQEASVDMIVEFYQGRNMIVMVGQI